MESGEVFPNAPLALVAAEVRYPPITDRTLGIALQRQIRDLISDDWVIQNDTSQTFEAGFGPAGPHAAVRQETLARITSRSRCRVITVKADAFIVEVTDYVNFAEFRTLLESLAAAVEAVLKPDGVTRVGLRYIDEITVGDTPRWSEWLPDVVLPPPLPGVDADPGAWTGAVEYRLASDRVLVFRFGTAPTSIVPGAGFLKRPKTSPGPFFTLDFDSSWQPDDIPAFRSDDVVSQYETLRAPIRSLFDSLLTPQLVDTFRDGA